MARKSKRKAEKKSLTVSVHRTPRQVHIPRPRNMWFIFRAEKRPAILEMLLQQNPNSRKTEGEVSCIASVMWSKLTPQEKQVYVEKARIEDEGHKQMYPDYQYRRGVKVKGKVVTGKVNEALEPVRKAASSETKFPKGEYVIPEGFEDSAPSVRPTSLPPPLQPIEPRINMGSAHAGNMVYPQPSFMSAKDKIPALKVPDHLSPIVEPKATPTATELKEFRTSNKGNVNIRVILTPEGDTVRFGKEVWRGKWELHIPLESEVEREIATCQHHDGGSRGTAGLSIEVPGSQVPLSEPPLCAGASQDVCKFN